MNFVRRSRSASQSSRISAPHDEEVRSEPTEGAAAPAQPNGAFDWDDDNDDDFDRAINDPVNQSHMRYMQSHPIGMILLGIVSDYTNLAKKTGYKNMQINIPDMCSAFHKGMAMERAQTTEQIEQNNAELENTIIHKELNAHKINATVEAPTNFSPVPVLTDQSKVATCLKIFPWNQKYSGSSKDNSMSIIEFLTAMKTAQEQYPLSEKEFIERLLAASTGPAHELILDHMDNGESASTIFHYLILNYDRRVSPELARNQLLSYKATRSSTLAATMSQIMKLANRASSVIPKGPSRKAYSNLEAVHALVRALPQYSSQLVSNEFHRKSTHLARACTFPELSLGLTTYRDTIDKDIREHGADANSLKSKMFNGKSTPSKPRYKSFVVSSRSNEGSQKVAGFMVTSAPTKNKSMHKNNITGTNNSNGQNNNRRPFQADRNGNNNFKNSYNRNGNNRNPHGGFGKTGSNPKLCSLCGNKSHMATDCRNMKDDSGKIVEIIPTYGTCSKCPSNVNPRLHHPEPLCPFRVGGPFNRRN